MSDVKAEWVSRVLGVSVGGQRSPVDPAAARAAAAKCLKIWLDAKDAADAGLSDLQSKLVATNDPVMKLIADRGLHGVSRGMQVGLRVALEEFARQPDPASGKAENLSRSVASFRRFLMTDPAVSLCDDNPFGAKVALRATLGKAMSDLDAQLRTVVG